jgi:hypothetical protein
MRNELNGEELALEAERAEAMYGLAMRFMDDSPSRAEASFKLQCMLNRLRESARGKKANPAYQKQLGTLYRQIDKIRRAEIAKLKADLELVQGKLNRLRERAR